MAAGMPGSSAAARLTHGLIAHDQHAAGAPREASRMQEVQPCSSEDGHYPHGLQPEPSPERPVVCCAHSFTEGVCNIAGQEKYNQSTRQDTYSMLSCEKDFWNCKVTCSRSMNCQVNQRMRGSQTRDRSLVIVADPSRLQGFASLASCNQYADATQFHYQLDRAIC